MTNLTEDQKGKIYVQLRDRFNELSFGYKPTESGVEFALLKRFFSPEDAIHMLEMEVDKFFTAEEYAKVSGRESTEAANILDDMSHRGLLFRIRRGNEPQYHVMPVAHGFYEFNLNHIEPEWVKSLFAHFGEGMLSTVYDAGIPFYRSVPINTEVVAGSSVLPYDDIEKQVRKNSVFAVSPCVCRLAARTAGAPDCGHRLETCITMGEMAEFYKENEIGRPITMEEVLDILHKSVEEGMIIQCCNSKESEIICSCSLCCCGILQAAKYFPGDAIGNISHYKISVESDKCDGCELCVSKCPMQAIRMNEDGISVTDDSCVACGNCVALCKNGARVLVQKSEEEIRELPDTIFDTYMEMQDLRRAKGAI